MPSPEGETEEKESMEEILSHMVQEATASSKFVALKEAAIQAKGTAVKL